MQFADCNIRDHSEQCFDVTIDIPKLILKRYEIHPKLQPDEPDWGCLSIRYFYNEYPHPLKKISVDGWVKRAPDVKRNKFVISQPIQNPNMLDEIKWY